MGGLGALAGGFGGRSGFNQGGRVDARMGSEPTGRRAGLSGVVHRAQGGQIVRMQPGGSVWGAATTPVYGSVMPPRLSSAADPDVIRERILEDDSALRVASQSLNPFRGYGDVYGESYPGEAVYFEDVETVPEEADKKETEGAAQGPAPVVEEPERSRETLVDQFKKLMEVPEAEMSWAERLQLASTLMNAGNKGSTGSFLGDLSQFGADTAGGVGKALSSRDARALAAQKRKIKTLKDFNQFAKDAQLTPIEIEQAKIDLGLGRARTRKLDAEADDLKSKKYEYDVPETGLIREAGTALKNVGTFNYDKTSFDKNTVKTPGTLDYDIAALAKMTNQSPRDLVAILNAKGLIITNNKGKHVLNREVFSDAKSKVVQSRAEGGLVGDDRPILRYPEDF